MDFELLNFWINKIGFDIRHDKLNEPCYLYLSLKADKDDFLKSYIIELSSDKNKILQFFGFDSNINYDNLSEKNLFEYLCTSSILQPSHIRYCSFKGPHAKNKLHEKFNKYLLDKNYSRHQDNTSINQQVRVFVNDAITYFQKEHDFTEYKEKRKMFDNVVQKKHYLMSNVKQFSHVDFNLFLVVHGILNVSLMNDETLQNVWKDFSNQNWSGARRYST